MRRRHVLQAGAAAAWVGTRPQRAAATPAAGADGGVRIGLTAVILADQAAFLARWSRDLSRRIGTPVRFVVRDEYQPMLDLLFAGDLDAAWICGFPFVRHRDQLRLLAVPLYEGRPLYQAYLIRARGNPATIDGWADLRGKVLAYSDPLSNSGWLVAQEQLGSAGIAARDLKRTFFAHGHRNVAEAVASGLAHAGSIDGYVWETMRQQGMPAAEQTEIAWRSPLHAFPPLAAHARIQPAVFDTLQGALLSMPQDDEGRTLLRALNLTGFTRGSPALFESIRRLAVRTREGAGTGVLGVVTR